MKRVGNRGRRYERGTMVVEAAIAFPLLLLLTLGAIKYGWLLYNVQQITNAARQGARTAAVLGATDANGVDAISDALYGTILEDKATYTVVDVTLPQGTKAKEATVTVTTSDIDFVNARVLFPVPATLRAVVRMAKEGS
jgi:Flp pilus assembly protein TadG